MKNKPSFALTSGYEASQGCTVSLPLVPPASTPQKGGRDLKEQVMVRPLNGGISRGCSLSELSDRRSIGSGSRFPRFLRLLHHEKMVVFQRGQDRIKVNLSHYPATYSDPLYSICI